MTLQITTLFIGLLALLQIVLTANVVLRRGATGITFQDGGDQPLMRRIRAHGNYTETVPIALLAMAASELSGPAPWVLWAGGLSLFTGRIIHAINLTSNGPLAFRIMGMAMTLLPMAVFGGWSLWQGI